MKTLALAAAAVALLALPPPGLALPNPLGGNGVYLDFEGPQGFLLDFAGECGGEVAVHTERYALTGEVIVADLHAGLTCFDTPDGRAFVLLGVEDLLEAAGVFSGTADDGVIAGQYHDGVFAVAK